MATERESQVFLAKLAEQAERYEEMVEAMKKVARMNVELSVEERNLFSVAYKNMIGARRASWRIVSSIENKEISKGADEHVKRIAVYREKIESELKSTCDDILNLLDNYLIAAATQEEGKVFYYKMKGDYHRYMAEYSREEDRKQIAENALVAYQSADDLAQINLTPTNPIRLGLALNFSVFFYEILSDQAKACGLAKKAFDDAISGLDTLSEESYKDSTLIMQLLRDNLSLWTASQDDDLGDEDDKLES